MGQLRARNKRISLVLIVSTINIYLKWRKNIRQYKLFGDQDQDCKRGSALLVVITRDQIGFRAEWSRKRVIPKEHLLVTISFALTLFRNVVSTLRYKSRSRASSRPRLNKNDIYLAGNCPFNLTNQKKKKKN